MPEQLTSKQLIAIKQIAAEIQKGKVIPIIGYDLLRYEYDDIDSEMDFLKAIIKEHTNNDPKIDFSNPQSGNDLISEYYHSLNINQQRTFKVAFSETIQRLRLNHKIVPESFKKLVCIKPLKLFINATFTNVLEIALNTYRIEERDEQNIKKSYVISGYHPTNPIDILEPAPEKFHINLPLPIIYNLFATHDSIDNEYVITDADYIELIYDLIEKNKIKFENILTYLKKSYLLFLGCNFPDWFFRLFIRICVGDRLDMTQSVQYKAVIDSLSKIDSSRGIFITQYGIQQIDINSNILVNEIYNIFYRQEGRPHLVQDIENNKAFISYCRGDQDIVKKISEQFKANDIGYFLDSEEVTTGDELSTIIKKEIDNSCILLAFVSNNLQAASKYFCLEWAYALHRNKVIWPVFIEFVDSAAILLPCGKDKLSEIKDKIIGQYHTTGIKLDENSLIGETDLNNIKKALFKCRTQPKI